MCVFILLDVIVFRFGIAQSSANEFPQFGRWKTQAFYATLVHFFGSYAVYFKAWFWLVIGILFIFTGAKKLRSKSIQTQGH